MYTNYIFDLYGTLVDINTDEDNIELWYKLSLFYSFKGALYTSNELKNSYKKLVKANLSSVTNTKYPDFPLENIFSKLYIRNHNCKKGSSQNKNRKYYSQIPFFTFIIIGFIIFTKFILIFTIS